MNEFIEKSKGLLKFYCLGAQIIGWLLIIAPIIWITVEILSGSLFKGNRSHIPSLIQISYIIQAVVLNFTFLGLVALGVAHFIKYVFESKVQPSLFLRIGDKILYMYAGFVILGALVKWVFQMQVIKATVLSTLSVSFAALLLPATAKALILIGLGKILHRVMPVLEESKTLV